MVDTRHLGRSRTGRLASILSSCVRLQRRRASQSRPVRHRRKVRRRQLGRIPRTACAKSSLDRLNLMMMAPARTSHDGVSACAAPLALVPEHKPLEIVNALVAKAFQVLLPLLTPKISARSRGVGRPIPLIRASWCRDTCLRCH